MKTYNENEIHHKVMIEFADNKRKWGYVSTMHSQSSHGIPVIKCDNDVYKQGDIAIAGITIVCNDIDVVNLLKKYGYMSISCTTDKSKKTGITMPTSLYDKIKIDANASGVSTNAKIVQILTEHYDKD